MSNVFMLRIPMSVMKMIDLDTKVFIAKTIVVLVFEINSSGIHMAMNLINQDIIVLF